MRKITIDPVTRIEGHAKIDIFLDDQGRVADTQSTSHRCGDSRSDPPPPCRRPENLASVFVFVRAVFPTRAATNPAAAGGLIP